MSMVGYRLFMLLDSMQSPKMWFYGNKQSSCFLRLVKTGELPECQVGTETSPHSVSSHHYGRSDFSIVPFERHVEITTSSKFMVPHQLRRQG